MAPVDIIKASPLHIIGNSTNINNIITITFTNIISRHSQVAALRDSGGIGGGGVKYFRGSVFINHSYIILLLPHQVPPLGRCCHSAEVATRFGKKKWEGRTVGSESSDANLEANRAEP